MSTINRIQLKRYTYFQQEQYKPVLDADGQPVINPATQEAETEITENAEYYYGNYFPIEVEPTNYTKGLYVIDYDKELPGKFKLWRADDHWLDLDGTKKMRGGIQAVSNFYFRDNKFGLDMNNSDIIGAYCIYFDDIVNDHNEGINFMRTNGNYDNIAALDGELYFTINVPKNNATVRLQYKVLTANNYNTFSPKLDGTGATGNWNINVASAKKLDHNVTINLTDTDNKNGVKGSITTDFSGTTVNIATEISPLDASKITSGIIDIERLPQGVLERLVPVANKAARFALTEAQVQNGDTVKQIDTNEMWYVSDDTKLNQDAGYEVYTSGRASSVPWTGVEGKPTQITLTGNVTGSVALGAGALSFGTTINANAVDNTKLSAMQVNTIKGRQGSAGDPQDLNPTQIRAILNVADGANNYVHPSYTSIATGFYKVAVDSLGHLSGVSSVSKADITALGIPAQDTTYDLSGYVTVAGTQTITGAKTFSTNVVVNGSIRADGGGYGSDIRFKDNIREIDSRKSSKINLYEFLNTRSNRKSGGVIAQELEKLYPEAVMVDETFEEKFLYVDYNYVFTILHAEHRKEIQALKETNIAELNKISIGNLFKLILLKLLKLK